MQISHFIALGAEKENIQENENNQFVARKSVNWSEKLVANKIPEGLVAVYGNFDISHNQLAQLTNCPEFITGTFYCNNNCFNDFKGGPKYVGKLNAVNNPELSSLDYAPVVGHGIEGDLRQTKLADGDVEFYLYAIAEGTWNANLTWQENLEFNCLDHPEIFKKDWDFLLPYRSSDSETRGRAAGTNTGII